jgi:hypothetical protein
MKEGFMELILDKNILIKTGILKIFLIFVNSIKKNYNQF